MDTGKAQSESSAPFSHQFFIQKITNQRRVFLKQRTVPIREYQATQVTDTS
jgi:hypothetical protein